MKVLIIGGTGLISTPITRQLLEEGHSVTLYNRGKSEHPAPGGAVQMVGDRTQYALFETQMAEVRPFDCVIDMVCFQPEEAESAVRAFQGRIGQFIFCSTVDVYTKPAASYPIREDMERRPQPSFAYAYAKAACERIFAAAHKRGDFAVTIIRPAYTYGEGRGILHTFRAGMHYLQRIRDGRPIIVHGDGSSLWSSCHRDDVGRTFYRAVGDERAYGKSYHVTGEEWMTWNQYHQRVAQAMGAPEPELVHIPTDLMHQALPAETEWCKENFQFNNIFDNSAARAELDFQYTISWEEGVRRVVDWLDERGRITDSDAPAFYNRLLTAWQQLGSGMVDSLADLREVKRDAPA